MARTTTWVELKVLVMPCCGHQLCWVNPRWPTYCPECGRCVYPDIKTNTNALLLHDTKAILNFHE